MDLREGLGENSANSMLGKTGKQEVNEIWCDIDVVIWYLWAEAGTPYYTDHDQGVGPIKLERDRGTWVPLAEDSIEARGKVPC